MRYLVQAVPDSVFWDTLKNAPLQEEPAVPAQFLTFGTFAEVVLQPFHILQSWLDTQAYTVPITATPFSGVVYFITPRSAKTNGHRVFVGLLHGEGGTKVVVCEVTLLQILIGFSSLVTASGNRYEAINHGVVYKGEKDPIQSMLLYNEPPGYLKANEATANDGSQCLTFDFSVDWMAEGTFNKEADVLDDLIGEAV